MVHPWKIDLSLRSEILIYPSRVKKWKRKVLVGDIFHFQDHLAPFKGQKNGKGKYLWVIFSTFRTILPVRNTKLVVPL
jgi:hypothetical protein